MYIGDAAGRKGIGSRSSDFADTDYKLALNLGVNFQTPESFFSTIYLRITISSLFRQDSRN